MREFLNSYYDLQDRINNDSPADKARARRVAKKCGLRASKSYDRERDINHFGGYQLIDQNNCIVAGLRYDLNAADVIELCLTH
jgi:hypothetical protein